MIFYLAKYYFGFSIMLGIAILMFFISMENFIFKSLFWSGVFSIYVTHRFLEKRNIWVLYYNLRLPKYVMLGSCFLVYETLLFFGYIMIVS